jgi:hypothetical protein
MGSRTATSKSCWPNGAFGPQVHVKGILGGTEEAGRHVGYLTKYQA